LVALQWGYHPIVVIPVNGFFFVIDGIFFAANSTKLFEGGWFPLLLAAVIAFVMLTWRSGVKLVESARGRLRQPEDELIETAVSKCHARLPGTAVFLASSAKGVPLALTQFIRHNHVMHQRILLLTVVIEEEPRIADEDLVEVIELIEGITRVILHFGFMQYPTIAGGLKLACEQGKLPGIDLADITYYIGRETIIPSEEVAGMAVARELVRVPAAQRQERGSLLRRTDKAVGRVRHRDRDLEYANREWRIANVYSLFASFASIAVFGVFADVLDGHYVLVLGSVEHDDALG